MKRVLIFSLSVLTLIITSCQQRDTGQLTGVFPRPEWYEPPLLGMTYIPAGSYTMGQSDEDVPFAHTSNNKTVSIASFYMDETEITNNEYRQFVYWVRDSIARRALADQNEEKWTIPLGDDQEEPIDGVPLDWSVRLEYEDEEVKEVLDPDGGEFYLQPRERFFGRQEVDVRKLMYKYYWVDLKAASVKGRVTIRRNGYNKDGEKVINDHRELKNDIDPFTEEPIGQDLDLGKVNKRGQNSSIRSHEDRSRFVISEEINIYPDTLVWVRDFTYSFNDPMAKMYFWHPAFDDYPVVGLTWQQANAFCVWRTQLLNSWLSEVGDVSVQDFLLPTEGEWEYAARGGLNGVPYPWGGYYIRNSQGCFLGNFKTIKRSLC